MLEHDDALPLHPTLLHPRTGLPLQAVGIRTNGQPVWPILGGAPDDDDQDDDVDDTDDDDQDDDVDDTDDEDEDDEELGAGGTKALKAERAKNKKLRAQIKTLRQQQSAPPRSSNRQRDREASQRGRDGRTTKDRRDQSTNRDTSRRGGRETDDRDDEPDEDELREELRREIQAETDRKLIKAAVIAGAAGRLANPKVAGRLLDLDDFELDDNGEIDQEELDDAIDELLEENPGLARASRRRRDDDEDDEDDDDRDGRPSDRTRRRSGTKFRGGADGGARGRGGKAKTPATLADAVAERMSQDSRRGGRSSTRRRSN